MVACQGDHCVVGSHIPRKLRGHRPHLVVDLYPEVERISKVTEGPVKPPSGIHYARSLQNRCGESSNVERKQLIFERQKLYTLMHEHPEWSLRAYARTLQHDLT